MTFKATADLSSLLYFPVMADSAAGTCKALSGSGNDVVLGILQNKPVSGEWAVVRVFGVSKAAVNGGTAVAVRDFLKAGATAQSNALVKSATDKNNVVGIALEAQTASANNVIEIFVLPSTLSHS